MARLTRSAVAYDLNISPHEMNVEYGDCVITYVFSSDLYRRKFIEKLEENRESINTSLSNRFGFKIVCNKVADLKLYTTVEKRGFLLYKGQDKVECLNDITLSGEQMMMLR